MSRIGRVGGGAAESPSRVQVFCKGQFLSLLCEPHWGLPMGVFSANPEEPLCLPQKAFFSLRMPHSQMPISPGREHSVFLEAGFTGLTQHLPNLPGPFVWGVRLMASPNNPGWETLVPVISGLEDCQAW